MSIWAEERKHYPLIEKDGAVYLDHSTSGLIADYTYDAMNDVLKQRMENGMDIDEYFDRWRFMDDLRITIGKMFNCDGDQVVYGLSSTHLLNILANGLKWNSEDNVVTTDITYPGDAYIWLNKKSEGLEVRFAKTDKAYISAEDLMSYTDEHTRVVCLTMVENKFGFRHDVSTIGKMCKERGIIFAVDGTQAANALYIDMKEMNIDFLAVSSYKWLMGEVGAGFACIEKKLLSKLSQSQVGWVGTENRRANDCHILKLSRDAKRFEYGGVNFLGYYGIAEVIKRNLQIGGKNIEAHIMSMVNEVYRRAPELKRLKLYGDFPVSNRAQVITFVSPPEFGATTQLLAKYGIRCRVFDGKLIRVGFHYCNMIQDVEHMFRCLKNFEDTEGKLQ